MKLYHIITTGATLASFSLDSVRAFSPSKTFSPLSVISDTPTTSNIAQLKRSSTINPPTQVRGGASVPALNAAPVATAAVTSIALPSLKNIVLATLLPTCLGYYRSEYGVSYGYGTATAITAYFIFQSLSASADPTIFVSVASCHALSIIFYGLRLNTFLLYREIFLERFRKFREKIEDRQRVKEDGKGIIGKFLNRTPFILSCALLYAGLAAPPLISAKLIEMGAAPTCKKSIVLYKSLVSLAWFGFGLGALGDYTKSFIKAKKGPDHVVTGGIYRFFRHPNYTGEIIGWTSSFIASIVAVLSTSGDLLSVLKSTSLVLGLTLMGNLGIVFVLLQAATTLEKRQVEKYGENTEYQKWIAKSWSGPLLSIKKKEN